MSHHFFWDYELGHEGYYAIYPLSAQGEHLFADVSLSLTCLKLPSTSQADTLMRQLVETLDALVGCQDTQREEPQ